ncbi:hypothetical protein EAS56_17915 [Bradyrhizobium guangzhouense]|uniref:Uncharacterized protein n=1 Tax=Bradyrhizobium guangzhouense TaxID=1325095 RepID=A0AAE5WXZ3_9BRAD|nr:hypothetical protein XH91_07685 [Bradyrhizobium guangzhouense]RXH12380.1 hypothetical protein EAS56_17915 [Bradyrhizobium guangzhouense]
MASVENNERNSVTVILRCRSLAAQLRRWAEASKDERFGCISAVHPSRLRWRCVASQASHLRTTD